MNGNQPEGEAEVRVDEVLREPSALLRAGESTLAKVLLDTNPWTGLIGTVISAQAARRQEERLRSFLVDVVQAIEEMRQSPSPEIDEDFIQGEAFVGILMGVLDEASRCSDYQRLKYLRGFLCSSAAKKRPDVTWLDLFQRYLARMSGVHIVVLGEIYERQRGYPASDRLGKRRLKNIPLSADDLQLEAFGNHLARISLTDLENMGLLVDWTVISGKGHIQENFSMTRNGMLFMRFLSSDWPSLPGIEPAD